MVSLRCITAKLGFVRKWKYIHVVMKVFVMKIFFQFSELLKKTLKKIWRSFSYLCRCHVFGLKISINKRHFGCPKIIESWVVYNSVQNLHILCWAVLIWVAGRVELFWKSSKFSWDFSWAFLKFRPICWKSLLSLPFKRNSKHYCPTLFTLISISNLH